MSSSPPESRNRGEVMDEPLFNELLESVKQADQIMTDHAELRRLAEDVIRIERSEDEPISAAWDLFDSAANPKTILALLDEIDQLKAESDRLRQGMKGDYDIDAWLEWTREKDQIKAENEVLRGALKQFAEMLKSINVPIDLDEIIKGTKP